MNSIGKRVRSIREARGMSLNELARRASIGPASISRVENELQGVTVETLAALCSALGLTLAEFFGADIAALPRGVRIPLLCLSQVQSYLEEGGMESMETSPNLIEIPEAPGAAQCLALKITDVSMQGARDYFRLGDVVIIHPTVTPEPGDFVLAIIEGQTVFRQYTLRQDHIELAPLNPFWATLSAPPDHIQIIGTLIEHRRYRRLETVVMYPEALQK